MVGAGQFVFVGQEGSLQEHGWDGPQRDKLWRYNQHYFDDLNAMGAPQRHAWHLALLKDWLDHNPPGKGNGWEPYPTSLRIVNWVKWALAGNQLPHECAHSLAVQARWLRKRLEWHLLGNHLFANAKALVFAGSFFEGPEAESWLQTGWHILARELPEQVLADGGHFERSTMYHALALEDVLDLLNVCRVYPSATGASGAKQAQELQQTAARMQQWLHAMCHPDGEIGFFNDAALGIAPAVAELDAYAARLRVEGGAAVHSSSCVALQPSGYLRLQAGDAVALLDVAPVGPDYLPGHAHADTLSFEFSLGMQLVLVNSGTSCYGQGPERLRQRGTAAHNTVVVEGEDSSKVWGGFRVARRARVQELHTTAEGDRATVAASHDGYTRLRRGLVHRRRWDLQPGRLVVEDELGVSDATGEARFHLPPGVQASAVTDPRRGRLVLPDGREIRWIAELGEPVVVASTWHPRFGASIPSQCLRVRLVGGRCRVVFGWS